MIVNNKKFLQFRMDLIKRLLSVLNCMNNLVFSIHRNPERKKIQQRWQDIMIAEDQRHIYKEKERKRKRKNKMFERRRDPEIRGGPWRVISQS